MRYNLALGPRTHGHTSRRDRTAILHKLTTPTVKKFKLIKSEDLNVKGMMPNHKLGLAISYLGFYEFRWQLEYKCKRYGASLVLVAQWFPSSLSCSKSGRKQDLPRSYQDLWLSILRYVDWRWFKRQYHHFELGTLGDRGIAYLSWDSRLPPLRWGQQLCQ